MEHMTHICFRQIASFFVYDAQYAHVCYYIWRILNQRGTYKLKGKLVYGRLHLELE